MFTQRDDLVMWIMIRIYIDISTENGVPNAASFYHFTSFAVGKRGEEQFNELIKSEQQSSSEYIIRSLIDHWTMVEASLESQVNHLIQVQGISRAHSCFYRSSSCFSSWSFSCCKWFTFSITIQLSQAMSTIVLLIPNTKSIFVLLFSL